MRNVLMVLYYFPPLGGIGTLRSLGHVKNLPANGWRPRVLTVKQGAFADVRDPGLCEDIPEGTDVVRTAFLDIGLLAQRFHRLPMGPAASAFHQFFAGFPPDRHIGWLPFAYRRARQIISDQKVDAIYTISAPYTSHLIGYLLKRATGLPWVADFGDEWTKNPFRSYRWGWQEGADAWLERRVLETADHVVVAWPDMVDLLSPSIKDKATTITCGFNTDDFKGPLVGDGSKFRITYTGSFYAAQQPGHFLAAMRELLEEGRIPVEELELVFVGRTRTAGFVGTEGTILERAIKRVGFVPHKEVVGYLRNADALLLIVSTERGEADIPGKTFEYIAAGRPILALVPSNGAAANLIRRTMTGVVVDPDNVAGIKGAVLELYQAWRRGEPKAEPNWNEIRKHEAAELCASLCEVLNRVAGLAPGAA